MDLLYKIQYLFEQIADGYPSTQRFSTYPISLRESFIQNEGGKTFKSLEGELLATSIKREYVPSTLKEVYKTLEGTKIIDVEAIQPLGSTYTLSKPELGDLDLLVKPYKALDFDTFKNTIYDYLYSEGIPVKDLSEKAREYKIQETSFVYAVISFLAPIFDDNNQITDNKVQVDLILAEDDIMYKWRFYWFKGSKDSAWKTAARNALLEIIAMDKGYVWGKDGLLKDGEIISTDVEETISIIFGEGASLDIIESTESVLEALEGMPEKDKILKDFNELVAKEETEGREMHAKNEKSNPFI